MIPQAMINHWKQHAPWPQESQVEQDLILSRALVEIFQDVTLSQRLALRGGTALHKLYVDKPMRYSEDIDLVQHTAGPIGPILDGLREKLDPVLGKPRRENNLGTVTLLSRMESEIPPIVPLKLKVEINSREHFDVLGITAKRLDIRSPWFEGGADIKTYSLDELLGTKLRALYQRRKGRDLFDFWVGLNLKGVEPERIVEVFKKYMAHGNHHVTRAEYANNLKTKLKTPSFLADLEPLLVPGLKYDPAKTAQMVTDQLISLL